ncbi:ribonuclease T2 [Punctularia strigosozonata HHB-11173 SS5]|uniref:ribonuclease T2 n=1 Tax=Punctularia strigosozonata (strain HHB-11173) TaxID=741275 RepID=UPI0004416B6D|nr:ribonuclease T2 [Punctularia strigosozonata HHB-11173 SS5]EIN13999.1 ribonuclease T2 [Punctularia strigosozonata HHB-11173 SS5]
MAATFTLVALLAAAASTHGHLLSVPNTYPNLTQCLGVNAVTEFSCENTTTIKNTCCTPTPGGLVLQTQFWSTYTGLEKKGQLLPKDSWTIHGLWPDNCDGSYEQYCDLSRQYDPDPSPAVLPDGTVVPAWNGTSIDHWIKDFGRLDLLDYMEKYWINQGASNTDFWQHEFSKHATCTSTFDVACYGENYKKHQDVVNFFDAVIRAFKQYPTFDMLGAAGILPSNKTTYSLSQIQNALAAQTGAIPYIGCKNSTVLSEIWYFSHVLGSEQYGRFKSINSTTTSSCSTTAPIWYYERTKTSEHEVRK